MINKETLLAEHFKNPEQERGHNTEIRFTFIRHSQKASGRVFAQEGDKISNSSISESGKERARKFGTDQLVGRKIKKAYATEISRTKETLSSAFEAAGINSEILQKSETTDPFFSLPALSLSPEFMKKYEAIMATKRQEFIDKNYTDKKFDGLTPDEQEMTAEYAEEPALDWYLSFRGERPDKNTPSPREQAAAVAFKINRLVNLPNFLLSNNKRIDLISSGHKTSTEAFLSFVITRIEKDKLITGFDRLEEIGGSLKILDSWDLRVQNDSDGKKHIIIILRRENGQTQEYGLNKQILHDLAEEYIKANQIKPKPVDLI